MPIYEYRCADCGHQLEALQRLADAPLVVCPACGKESLTKLMSAVGFQLKGSGWYATDFKHSGSKPAEKGAAKSDAANEASGGGEKGETSASKDSGAATPGTKPTAPASSESKTTSTETKSSATTTAAKPAATGS